ncbi:hypothetical protein MPSEU_000403400 [Mayamaea pseudoterrestris]|nr:hypothetical protein MPSEU_000403400 [Mayamaea pseudoterrestris]
MLTTLASLSDVCTPARAETSDSNAKSSDAPFTSNGALCNTVTPSEPKDAAIDEEQQPRIAASTLATNNAASAEDDGTTSAATLTSSNTTTVTSSKDTASSSASKRGLVSRRGRGLGNPGQRGRCSRSADYDLQTENVFETPMLQRSSVTFSPERDYEEDGGASLDLQHESMDPINAGSVLNSQSPNPEAFLGGPTTPCRNKDAAKKHDFKLSPPARQGELDFYASTPTDFALDYGKHYPTSFDTSNVLAWLNSPNPNQLFSPGGGLSSMMNSPRFAPRTPRTPTISMSFFFSDVAGLPKNKDSGVKEGNGGRDHIICISPLASKTNAVASPMNLKDVFNSPPRPCNASLPMLADDTPMAKPHIGVMASDNDKLLQSGRKSLEQVERDLMEDEDLSVLLQLAANTAAAATKSSSSPSRPHDGASVFRTQSEKSTDMPNLHLPMILGNGKTSDNVEAPPKILRKKSSSRDDDDHHRHSGLTPPTLGMRSMSSSGGVHPNEFFGGGDSSGSVENGGAGNMKLNTTSTLDGAKKEDNLSKLASLSAAAAAATTQSSNYANASPYPLTLSMLNGHDVGHYYNVNSGSQGAHPSTMSPSGIPPGAATGTLRMVVGGPPPPNSQPDVHGSMMGAGNSSATNKTQSLYHGDYTNGLPTSSYHHPGMYPHPHFGPPPIGYPYPPPGHFPVPSRAGAPAPLAPQSHMPLFSSPLALEKKKGQKNKTPRSAAGAKRPSPPTPHLDESGQFCSPDKKSKKSRGGGDNGSAKRKKNRSPQVADMQKCAETILAVNAASGGKHDKEAELAAAIMRGVTMRPSGKWQAQLYYSGKSRYIGVFDSREKAALAYEIAREKLKAAGNKRDPESTELLVNQARKAAFDGVNEQLPA